MIDEHVMSEHLDSLEEIWLSLIPKRDEYTLLTPDNNDAFMVIE